MLSRTIRHAAQGAAALAVAVGSVGVAHLDKSVALSVDGSPQSVHVFGSTVRDALDKQGIRVGEHDVVVPSLDSEIADGDRISVRYGRKLTVTVDGATLTLPANGTLAQPVEPGRVEVTGESVVLALAYRSESRVGGYTISPQGPAASGVRVLH